MKILSLVLFFVCCSGRGPEQSVLNQTTLQTDTCNSLKNACTLSERFCSPEGFKWLTFDSGSFGFFLSTLKLKPAGTLVKLYDGRSKDSGRIYKAVVDMEITPRDLQQCADAVMRLRGEFLFNMKRYSEISFRFLGDGKLHSYIGYSGTDRTYRTFRKYMDHVFAFANTASLIKQLRPVPMKSMQPGDVFIQSGNPYGHAVMVVGMCMNASGEKKYMLAQSYMPAQETQILLNPANGTVWYNLDEEVRIETPEWTFYSTDLMRW